MASPSPRDRSASPAREPPAKKTKSSSSGFKWKDKRPRDSDDRTPDHLERGYRDRYDRDSRRSTGPARREEDGSQQQRSRPRSPRGERDGGRPWRARDDEDSDRDRTRDQRRRGEDRRSGEGNERGSASLRGKDERRSDRRDERKPKKKDKPVSQPPPADTGEPMIVVNVNDRLGTKAAIPCLASDSIKAFKAMVAAHIGRQPHEILLKRQGERPFKDQLSLQDYGVSNGVQLDLELDTGD